MKDFNDIKDVVLSSIGKAADAGKGIANKAADAGKGIANKAADKAKSGARYARLKVEIASERENMKKAYTEIGKLYYSTHKDDPEGFFIQLCDEVTLAQKNIADKEAEIEALRPAEDECCDCDDFEKIVEDEEAAAGDGEDDEVGIEIDITIEKTRPDEDEDDEE